MDQFQQWKSVMDSMSQTWRAERRRIEEMAERQWAEEGCVDPPSHLQGWGRAVFDTRMGQLVQQECDAYPRARDARREEK